MLTSSEKRGLSGILGRSDGSEWRWKNSPAAFQRMFKCKWKAPVVTLEAIADQSLCTEHDFICISGYLNDIKIVEVSPLSENIASVVYLQPLEYRIKEVSRNKPYWLCNIIYPR